MKGRWHWHHHRWPPFPWRRRHWGRRLHGRIFAWFVTTILVTTLSTAGVAHALGPGWWSSRPLRGLVFIALPAFMIWLGAGKMARRIEIAAERELLGSVSHELRTPLGHLRILAEMLREQGTSPQALADLDRTVAELEAVVERQLACAALWRKPPRG